MLEGGSRWNINRERETMNLANTSQTRLYDVRLMSTLNTMSQRVFGVDLLPEFKPPGNPTGIHCLLSLIKLSYIESLQIGHIEFILHQNTVNHPCHS